MLIEDLSYKGHERDMIVLQHVFDIQWPSAKRERRISALIAYGQVSLCIW